MNKTWSIDAEGVLTISQGFRRRNRKPDFYDDIAVGTKPENKPRRGEGF